MVAGQDDRARVRNIFQPLHFRPTQQREQWSHEDVLEQPIPHRTSRGGRPGRCPATTLPTCRCADHTAMIRPCDPRSVLDGDRDVLVSAGARGRRLVVWRGSAGGPGGDVGGSPDPAPDASGRCRPSRGRRPAARRCARRSPSAADAARLPPERPTHTPGTTPVRTCSPRPGWPRAAASRTAGSSRSRMVCASCRSSGPRSRSETHSCRPHLRVRSKTHCQLGAAELRVGHDASPQDGRQSNPAPHAPCADDQIIVDPAQRQRRRVDLRQL